VEISTKDIGRMEREKEMVSTSGSMATPTMENGLMVICVGLASGPGLMVLFMKAIGAKIFLTELEQKSGTMGILTKESGTKARNKAKGCLNGELVANTMGIG